MKINYKITTIVLLVLLLITYTWHLRDIFNHDTLKCEGSKYGKMQERKKAHMMPSGEMMMGDSNKMGIESVNMMDMTMSDMIKMMEGKTGVALEKEFIAGMIPHHQGAVDMAGMLLRDKTISPEIKKFAEDIIKAQEGEIKMMNEWLKKY